MSFPVLPRVVTNAASRRVASSPPVVVVAAPVSPEPKHHASLLAAVDVSVAGGRAVPAYVCLGRFVHICCVASVEQTAYRNKAMSS